MTQIIPPRILSYLSQILCKLVRLKQALRKQALLKPTIQKFYPCIARNSEHFTMLFLLRILEIFSKEQDLSQYLRQPMKLLKSYPRASGKNCLHLKKRTNC